MTDIPRGPGGDGSPQLERASLPDRVEAAARALEQSRGYAVPGYWHEVAKTALAAADACEAERNPNPTAVLTPEQREAIADEVLAEREVAFERSFEIDCPECGKPVGQACRNLGSAGGPINHTKRIGRP